MNQDSSYDKQHQQNQCQKSSVGNVNVSGNENVIYIIHNQSISEHNKTNPHSINSSNEISDKSISQIASMNSTKYKDKPVYIYFSSCLEDDKIRDNLIKRLCTLEKDGIIEIFHRGTIRAGEDIDLKSNEQLAKANIILLLVSNDYLSSSKHRDIEVKKIMRKYNSKNVKIIPILIEDCHWEREVYKHLNPLPRDRKPINTGRKNDILAKIAREIIDEVDVLKKSST